MNKFNLLNPTNLNIFFDKFIVLTKVSVEVLLVSDNI